jgi:hypothetical protein
MCNTRPIFFSLSCVKVNLTARMLVLHLFPLGLLVVVAFQAMSCHYGVLTEIVDFVAFPTHGLLKKTGWGRSFFIEKLYLCT